MPTHLIAYTMDKKKIVHVTQSVGGVKRYILNILENYDKSGYDHILISPDQKFNQYVLSNVLVSKVYYVNIVREPNFVKDISAVIKVISILKNEQPYLVHAHSSKGGTVGRLACWLYRAKCVFTPHGFSHLSFFGGKRIFFLTIERMLRPMTHKLLAVSASEADRALNEVNFNAQKVYVVPNSISISNEKKDNYSFRSKIGMIGRLTIQKNPLEFAKLALSINAHSNTRIQFILLGAGFHDHLKTELEKLIKKHEMDDYFEIRPWNEEKSIYNFFEEIDIYVMTSRFEGLPFSLLEAMSFGLPCVVSDVDGNKDAITHQETGYVYSSFDELVDYTEKLLNRDLREKVGESARRSIEKDFNIKKRILEIEECYNF